MANVRLLANAVSFSLGWGVSVYGAANDKALVGPIVIAVLLVLQSFFWQQPLRHLRFVCTVGVLGTLWESVAIRVGLYVPADAMSGTWLCPLWITALWAHVGGLIYPQLPTPTSLKRSERGSIWWAIGGGALAAAFLYPSAALLGAIRPLVQMPLAITIWALSWGVLLPILRKLSNRLAVHSTGDLAS